MPKFRVWRPEYGDEDDGHDIEATEPAAAAEKYAELRDAAAVEYSPERVLMVRGPKGVEEFVVTLRSEPVYTARKAPKPKKPKRIAEQTLNGHRLETFLGADGRRTFRCASFPDLAAKYDGAPDSAACVAEFERRASGGAPAAEEQGPTQEAA